MSPSRRPATLDEGKLGRLDVQGRGGTAERRVEFVGLQVGRERKLDGLGGPADVGGGDGLALHALPCAFHAIGKTTREDGAVGGVAVVVLAGPEVAAGAVEVDVEGARKGLVAEEAGDAREVRVGDAGAVIALGMGGVVGEDGHGLVMAPQAHGDHQGVYQALRRRAQGGVWRGGVPDGPHEPVGARHAPVGGHLKDIRLAPPDVGKGNDVGGGPGDGVGRAKHGGPDDVGVEASGGEATRGEDVLGGAVGDGGVVLVEGMDGDAGPCRAGRRRQQVTEGVMGLVGDPDPVDGGEDDGVAGAADHHAAAAEGEVPGRRHGVIGQAGAGGGGGVGVEGRDGKRLGARDEQAEAERDGEAKGGALEHGIHPGVKGAKNQARGWSENRSKWVLD